MTGSQGRFPPAAPPPNPQWRPESEAARAPQMPSAPRWPPQQQPTQQQPFPPNYQPQPPSLPAQAGQGHGHGHNQSQSHQSQGHAGPPAAQQDPGSPGYGWQHDPHSQGHSGQPPPAGYGYQPQPQFQPPSRVGVDPATYDLGSYSYPAGQPPARPAGLRTGRPTQPSRDPAQQQWSPQPVDPYPYSPTQPGAPAQHPQAYGYQPPQATGVPAAQHERDAAYDEEVEYEEAPPRRRRWLVAAALVGSIGLGGGLAYVYKTAFASKSGDNAQVVKAPREPARVAPTERGGKQLPNSTNNTVMNRVPPEGSVAAAGGTTDSTGVRRVPTVPVDRNLAPLPPAPPTTSTGVPGMIVVGGNNPGMPAPMPPPSFEQQPRAVAPPPPQPRVAAAPPTPPARPAPQRTPAPEAAEPPPARQAAVTPAQPAAPRAKPAGYVAVLGYQRSQLEAMKMMADLQQKYEALRDKKLEIVQSDQSSRGLGVIYRVVVGPPGSITPAKTVCQQLYDAGMRQSGCYPLASN